MLEIDEQIDELTQEYSVEMENLQSIPGVGKASAIGIISEIGVDMSVFPNEHHLASWARMSPENNESGEKKDSKTVKGNSHLQSLLVECGWGATQIKYGFLERKYQSLVGRRGKKKALVAVGHKIIVACYHVLDKLEKYKEPDLNPKTGKARKKSIRNYLNKIDKLRRGNEALIKLFEKASPVKPAI